MEPQHNIWSTIYELLNQPLEQRSPPYKDFEHFRNTAVSAACVFSALSQSFSRLEIEQEVSRFFLEMIATFRSNERPSAIKLFYADCCLMLVTMTGGCHSESDATECPPCPIQMDNEVIRGIVETFPHIGCYGPVCCLIERHLAESEVLEALCAGLSISHPLDVTFSLLEGIRLYYGQGRKDEDPSRLASALLQLRSVLIVLEQSPDPTLRHAVHSALSDLSRYRRP
jgi:hypothetical protein